MLQDLTHAPTETLGDLGNHGVAERAQPVDSVRQTRVYGPLEAVFPRRVDPTRRARRRRVVVEQHEQIGVPTFKLAASASTVARSCAGLVPPRNAEQLPRNLEPPAVLKDASNVTLAEPQRKVQSSESGSSTSVHVGGKPIRTETHSGFRAPPT